MQAGLVYTLAHLVAFSVNDPKKMPKFEKVFPDPSGKTKVQSPQEMMAAMDAWVAATAHLATQNQERT